MPVLRSKLVTDAKARKVQRMRNEGWTWRQITRATGLEYDLARSAIDAEYNETRKARVNKSRRALSSGGRPQADFVRRQLASIPADTRTLTGRIMGDPLPGRSALEKQAS